MVETFDSQTLSSVFLARVINCFCSSELVGFFFRGLYFYQNKLEYHSRQQVRNLGRLANRCFVPMLNIYGT